MKFENKLDRKELHRAITEWVLETDGYAGAIGGIYAVIPWTEEMQSTIAWDMVECDFSSVIPDVDEGKTILKTAVLNNSFSQFEDWVNKIENDIVKVYDECINGLNSLEEKNNTINKPLGDFISIDFFTGIVFNSFNDHCGKFYELDFGDEGNTIFATNKKTNEHFTITITKD